MNEIMKLLYTRREAAFALGCSERTVDYLISRGELQTRRIGKKVQVQASSLRKYANGNHPEGVSGEQVA